MTLLLKACTDPITDFVVPVYCLSLRFQPKELPLASLILASLRIATVVAFFFLTAPSTQAFCWIFGVSSTVGSSFTFALQFLIHPYAAALLNGFVHGGYPIAQRVIHAVTKGQMIFTPDDVGGCFRAIAFCVIAQPLKDYTNRLDRKYQEWSMNLAHWLCKQPELDDVD